MTTAQADATLLSVTCTPTLVGVCCTTTAGVPHTNTDITWGKLEPNIVKNPVPERGHILGEIEVIVGTARPQ